MIEQNKKRGPKPKYGEDEPCKNRSVSMPDGIWHWCEEESMLDGVSVSSYIVALICKDKKRKGG